MFCSITFLGKFLNLIMEIIINVEIVNLLNYLESSGPISITVNPLTPKLSEDKQIPGQMTVKRLRLTTERAQELLSFL